MDPDLIGATYEQTSQRMAENKVGATFDYCMQMWLEPSVNAENVEFLPIANLETGYEPYIVIEPSFFSWQKWAVTKDCKDPEAVAALLDVLYSDRYEELSAWGIEGETYEVVDGRRQLMEGIGGAYWEQNAKDRKTPGGSLWSGCVFPHRFPVHNGIPVHLPPRAQKRISKERGLPGRGLSGCQILLHGHCHR